MKTKFPYEGKIDFGAYLNEYLQREDAIRRIPTDEELQELARKTIVREQLVLTELPEGTPAETGDTAVLKTESALPKFNKPAVTVTLGRGLYNRELENALVGKKVGETVERTVNDQPVKATLLTLKRKQVPAPTDEMVKALQVKDLEGKPIETVEDFTAFTKKQKTMEILQTVNYYVMEALLKDHPMTEFDADDVRILGELEAESLKKYMLEHDGIDLTKEVPKAWEEHGITSLDSFLASRGPWYQIKITQCLILLNILDLPCEGKTDLLDHYEVLSELQMKMFDHIKAELERRN